MEYFVADSKMDDFLKWLENNGYRANTDIERESDDIALETISYSQIEA